MCRGHGRKMGDGMELGEKGDNELWSERGSSWQRRRVGKGLSDGPVMQVGRELSRMGKGERGVLLVLL